LAVERAVAAAQYAAMTLDADDGERHRAVHVAKAAAGNAVTRAAKDAAQVHGGIGYTWEHDLHLFLRHAYGSEHWMGTTGWHHDRLADLLLAFQ
jgi:alkylation response protein AidB-like acyl-CoA dehydrogenase